MIQHITKLVAIATALTSSTSNWQAVNYGGQSKLRLFGMDRNEPTEEGARE